MRSGQPKCICAPKCRSTKNVNKNNVRILSNGGKTIRSNADKLKRNVNADQQRHRIDSLDNVNNRNIGKHRSNQRQRRTRKFRKAQHDDADDLFSSDVQFIDPINNRSIHVATIKSDRLISIMTSDSMPSSNSHRFRKTKRKHTNSNSNNNNNSRLNVNGDSNVNSEIIGNTNLIGKNDTMLMHHRDRHARKRNPHRNGTRESQRLNDRNRSRQAHSFESWEDKVRLGFYGHDSTYTLDDNSVRRN